MQIQLTGIMAKSIINLCCCNVGLLCLCEFERVSNDKKQEAQNSSFRLGHRTIQKRFYICDMSPFFQ